MVDTRGLVWPTGGCFKNCYVKGTQNPFLKMPLDCSTAQTASCCLTLGNWERWELLSRAKPPSTTNR
jgi:hypothetical protein